MKNETLNYLHEHAEHLDLSEPLTITQDGAPLFVIESFEQYTARSESLALVQLLAMGSRDAVEGRTCSVDELKDRLARRFNQKE